MRPLTGLPGATVPLPAVADIASYLAGAGWQRQPTTWRGASVWLLPAGDHEIVIPPSDSLGDSPRRKRDILRVLSLVEGRPAGDVARDIAAPLVDVLACHTHPRDVPSGTTKLTDGLAALEAITGILTYAGRAVLEGPRLAYGPGAPPAAVQDIVAQARLAPTRAGSYVYTLELPVSGSEQDPSLTRSTLGMLYDAVTAARAAAGAGAADLSAFDETLTAGVSANLCDALAKFAGRRQREPFELTFAWARGLATDLPAAPVAFEPGMAPALVAGANRLRALDQRGEASITGHIDSVYDRADRADRHRILVRGDFLTAQGLGARRTIWLRLPDQPSYDAAIAAHQSGAHVRVTFSLAPETGTRRIYPALSFAVLT